MSDFGSSDFVDEAERQLLRHAYRLWREHRSLRFGQALVQALGELKPSWSVLLVGEPFDPFYDDERAPAFLEWFRSQAARVHICSAHQLWEPGCPRCQVVLDE